MPCVCLFNSLEDNYNITIKKQVRTFECDNTTIEYRNSSRMFKCRILIGTSVVLELFWCFFFWFSKMVDNISEPISEDIEVEFQNTKNKGDNQTVFLTFIPKVHGLWLFWLAFFLSLCSLTGYFGVCMLYWERWPCQIGLLISQYIQHLPDQEKCCLVGMQSVVKAQSSDFHQTENLRLLRKRKAESKHEMVPPRGSAGSDLRGPGGGWVDGSRGSPMSARLILWIDCAHN